MLGFIITVMVTLDAKLTLLAILSTDLTLTAQEIMRIYGMRGEIEVSFKCAKSLLRLQKEFQGRSYDLLVIHTTIVFSRYILLAWQHRQSTDQRSFGGLFYLLCERRKLSPFSPFFYFRRGSGCGLVFIPIL